MTMPIGCYLSVILLECLIAISIYSSFIIDHDFDSRALTQLLSTCSKSTMVTPEQSEKSVQS